MIIKLMRWFMGYVHFTLRCAFPEKFINLTVNRGIAIWDIKKILNGISGKSMAGEYKELRSISKNCDARIRLTQKKGLPFIFNKYRKRKGVIAGILIFIGVIYFLSSYIWSINISGNNTIASDEILNTMEDLGLSPGSLKNRIDIPMLEQEAMIRLPNLAWLSINMTGSHAEILIKEKIIPPNVVGENKPCNIKASIDGVIERIETYKGTSIVNPGDAVLKGQLLISGIIEDSFGRNSFVHSEGKVYAYTTRKLEETVNLSQIKPIDTGKVVKRYRFKFFGIEIPFSLWYKTDDTYRYEFYLNRFKIGNVSFPIILRTEEWHEQTCSDVNLSYKDALEQANKILVQKEETIFKDIQIINKHLEDKEVNNMCVLSGTYKCLEDVSFSEEINLD